MEQRKARCCTRSDHEHKPTSRLNKLLSSDRRIDRGELRIRYSRLSLITRPTIREMWPGLLPWASPWLLPSLLNQIHGTTASTTFPLYSPNPNKRSPVSRLIPQPSNTTSSLSCQKRVSNIGRNVNKLISLDISLEETSEAYFLPAFAGTLCQMLADLH